MARSIYVMPIVIVAGKYGDERREKYSAIVQTYGTRTRWDYGDELWCLVAMDSVSPADDASLTGNSDVFKLPDNLDTTMGSTGVRNTVRNRLEAVNMPGTWVQTSTPFRDVVRLIGALCQFGLRYTGEFGGRWFGGAISLDSTLADLTPTTRQQLSAAADSFGFDSSGFTLANTLRSVTLSVAQQYVAAGLPLDLLGPL